jgi:acyl-CoA synthetase (AMP-forming)/AMP-acid ligase II
MYTLKDVLLRAVMLNANGIAIYDGDKAYTWAEIHARIEAIARALIGIGFKPGDRMAIMALNSPRYYELQYAVLWAGGTVVPINTRYAAREMIYCLDDLDGAWLCADDDMLLRLEGVRSSLHGTQGLLFIGTRECPDGYVGWETLLQGESGIALPEVSVSDIAIIYYTGGTTGLPKGVMLAHSQVLAGAQAWAAAFHHDLSETDVYLHVAPMFHMADGIMCFAGAIAACRNVFMGKFDLQPLVDTCNRYHVSWITLVPTMARMICTFLTETGQTMPSLRLMVYGAAPMPRAILDLVMKTFPKIELYHGYGATEALSITILGPEHHTLDEQGEKMMRSCGRPFRGVLLSIQDANRHMLPPGQVGEVCIRSNAVMKGYWNKPALTREVIVDKWYRSGDAGYLDEHGYLFLVDRVKDMLITGGENVYSAEVENVLALHPAVDECAVIGLPDEKWGELVHAVVRLKKDRTATGAELQQHCRGHLAGYKVPKSVEITDKPLPKTPVGKLNKGELKRLVLDARR